jgi:hypothetical protein
MEFVQYSVGNGLHVLPGTHPSPNLLVQERVVDVSAGAVALPLRFGVHN